MITTQIKLGYKLIKRLFVVIGSLLLFFVFIELLRAYQTLAIFHPIAGWLFLIILLALVICGSVYSYRIFHSFPMVITPPDPVDLGGINSDIFLKARLIYLQKYTKALINNPAIDREMKMEIQMQFNSHPREDLDNGISWLENKCIQPALDILDNQADAVIRNTVRDTMIAVIMSPFKSLDSIVILSRNGKMFLDLVKLYNQHPGMIQTFRFAKDVMMIITSVNILNYTERLTEKLMRNIPILNRTTDDVIQGIGVGILTTSVGKAAINRCRAFYVWNADAEKSNFLKASAKFGGHVRGIFVEDVLPSLGTLWVEAWKKVRSAIDKTLGLTQTVADYSKEKSRGMFNKIKKIIVPKGA